MGRIAQLGERSPYKAEVTGSSPVPPTTLAPYRGAPDGAGSVDPEATPRPVGLPVRKLPLLEQTPDLLSENLFVHHKGSVAGVSQRRSQQEGRARPAPTESRRQHEAEALQKWRESFTAAQPSKAEGGGRAAPRGRPPSFVRAPRDECGPKSWMAGEIPSVDLPGALQTVRR